MGQQVKVFRSLEFQGHAGYNPNIGGNPMYTRVFFTDHFVADADEKDWVESTQGATIAYSTELGGAMKCTTAGSLDQGEFTHAVIWGCAKNCTMEARVKLSSTLDIVCVVGFADAAHGANDQLAAELSSSALVSSRGTEVAALIFDTDSDAVFWYYGAYKTGTEGTPVVTTVTPTAGAYENLRVAMNTDGDATFYRNGVAVGFLPTCVTTGTLLTPYVAFMARTASERIGYVDRITMWQDE